MTRITRDIPASCCCDSWKHGIRTIDGQYPDDNREFTIAAGDGIEITPITAGIEVAVRTPIPGPMIFRGTVGTSGTIATLPAANANNLGYTYVAITAGTTPDSTPKSYDVGDMLVSNGAEWTVIPSGDDPVAWSQITGTPTTLSGYGITDAVDISSAQDISGYKKMTGSFAVANTFSQLRFLQSADLSTSDGMVMQEVNYDANNKTYVQVDRYRRGSATLTEEHTYLKGADGTNSDFSRYRYDNGVAWSQTPNRTYNSSNTSDIVNVAMLQASSDVVHRTGNESIAGVKTFDNQVVLKTSMDSTVTLSGYQSYSHPIRGTDNRDMSEIRRDREAAYDRLYLSVKKFISDSRTDVAYLDLSLDSNGTAKLTLRKNINGVSSSTTVATL